MENATHHTTLPSGSRLLTSFHPTLVLVAISLATFCYFREKWGKTPKRLPPGPRGIPFLGCLLQLIRSPLGKLREYADTYGPVCSLKIGPMNVVVLNTVEAMREAFITKGSLFNGRPVQFQKIIGIEGGIVLLQHGKFHTEQRMLLSKVLQKLDDNLLESIVTTHMKDFNQALENSKGSPVQICPLIQEVLFACVGQLTFGIKTEVSHIRKLVAGNLSNNPFIVLSGKVIPESVKPKISKYVDMTTNFYKSLKKITELVIEKRKHVEVTGGFGDIIEGFLHVYEDIKADHERSGDHGSPFLGEDSTTDKQLATILMDCYQAGMEAVSAQALWVFLLLARNLHVQRKIQEEMDQVVGEDITPGTKHKKYHPYTSATFNEIQRIRPSASLGAPHGSSTDAKLCGYDIPAETFVLANIWAAHMDPRHWDEPEEFRPERFLDADGNLKRPESFVPFSLGIRQCPGEVIVKKVMFLIITNVLRRFTFTMAEEPAPGLGQQGINFAPHTFQVFATPRRQRRYQAEE